jgi:DNA (cytosine-5)-methyltransferase 1
MELTLGSTYSGAIDAFAYAAEKLNDLGAARYEVLWQIEKERQAHRYLKQNHPNAKRYYFDEWFEQYQLQPVDIICGGDPCQPHSNAGDRLGTEDDRFRWPVMFKLIEALRPNWIINENVIGSISNMVLDQKITDLEKIGYACQPYIIPAVATNAHHQRGRVFLVANANVQRRRELLCANYGAIFEKSASANTLGASGNAFLQFEQSVGEPALFTVANGLSDQVFRLGAAGNSIVSTIPIILLQAIYEIEKMNQ